MKRNPTFIIIMFIYILLIVMPTFLDMSEDLNLNPFDYARITDVDYKAVVVDEPGSKGKVIITERLTFDIHAASKDNLFWELWRDLPEDYIDGVKVDYTVNSVKQILSDGTKVTYLESPKLYWDDSDYTSSYTGYGPGRWYHSKGPYNEDMRRYECVFFYVDGLYREEVVFEIEYEMNNAALRYNDCSELYLCMYSEETIKYLESFKGQILFPNKDMPKRGNFSAYTYGTNSHTFPFTLSTILNPGYHTFSFELDEDDLKFRPYNQYIEFSLVSYGADKHIFTNYASRNTYYNSNVLSELREEQEKYEAQPSNANTIKLLVLLICVVSTIFILIYPFRKDKKIRKKYIFYEPTMQMDYFREIPSNLDPNFAANLVFCKEKSTNDIEHAYPAIILSLARKGYIELSKINNELDWTFSNVKIIVKYNPTPNPVTTETSEPQTHISEEKTNKEFNPIIPTEKEEIYDTFEDFAAAEKQETHKELEALTLSEEHYFKLIIRHSKGTEISMSNFQERVSLDFEYTNSFIALIKNSIMNIGISQKYFQKSSYEQPKNQVRALSTTFIVIGILFITLCNIISYQTPLDFAFGSFFILGFGFILSALHLRKLSKKYILLTQFGEDEYVKWRGLYNFLNSETLMNERTVIELPIWEQYLVYATAFGISDKVINALKIRCPEVDTSPILSNPYFHSRSFYSSSRSFKSAIRTASHTARSYSYGGYGGHGGYGGGGRGGGGGRRRSLIFN